MASARADRHRRHFTFLARRAYAYDDDPLSCGSSSDINAGTIRFRDRLLFLTNALKQHHVGLEERDDGLWSLYLGTVLLGRIDEATMKVFG